MAGISFSGLASGLDWQSLVNQLMAVSQQPITRLQAQQSANTDQVNALTNLQTQITALQTAVTNLKSADLFTGRIASSTVENSTWTATTTPGTAVGTHVFDVSQIATKAVRQGAADISGGLNASSDVSALTLATMRTATAVTAGTLTINGAQVTIATTDTLQGVFDKISTATGGAVTGAYDATTDKVTLSSTDGTSPITMAAANDTSNFFAVMKITNSGAPTATSFGTLGSVALFSAIDSAGLRTPPVSGAGTFTINGVSISYDTTQDSVNTVMKAINSSSAGVTATYDTINDRINLTNNSTGDLGIAVTDPNGLLQSLGLGSTATVNAGKNAEYTIDGGPTLISKSNTLDTVSSGIPGLAVTVDSATSQTISITADTAKMSQQINTFISAYNNVTAFIDSATQITTANGKVSTAVLSGNREVQSWSDSMRALAFGAIQGATGAISTLDNMGIGFTGTANTLSITDANKLADALQKTPNDVENFFTTASTGFAAQFTSLLTSMTNGDKSKQTSLTSQNSDLDNQIAAIQRQLDSERTALTNSFLAMEQAQATLQQESQQLNAVFPSGTNSSTTSTPKSSSSK